MFGFLKKNPKPVDADVRPSQLSQQFSASDKRKAIQMELVPVVLKDTLRVCGVPPDLLGCQCRIIPTPQGQEEFHVSLIIRRWDEEFLKYAYAFERMLVRGLDRFDPTVDHSTYVLSWKFGAQCGCPYMDFPAANSGFIHSRPASLGSTGARDLLPAAKPNASSPTAADAGDDDDDDSFAPTSIAPLN